jgi:hypothetical protein
MKRYVYLSYMPFSYFQKKVDNFIIGVIKTMLAAFEFIFDDEQYDKELEDGFVYYIYRKLNVGDLVRLHRRSWKEKEFHGLIGIIMSIQTLGFDTDIYECKFTGRAPSFFKKFELVKLNNEKSKKTK